MSKNKKLVSDFNHLAKGQENRNNSNFFKDLNTGYGSSSKIGQGEQLIGKLGRKIRKKKAPK